MATVTTGRMTAEEFWEWCQRPENAGRRCELVNGEIEDLSSPGELHGAVCGLMALAMWNYVIQRGAGYVCINETGLIVARTPDSVRGPDLIYFSESRSLDQLSRRHIDRVPQLIIEVLSPNDQLSKVNVRIKQYLRRGIPLVWLVDPDVRIVTVYQPDREHQVLDETDELTGGEVLPGFRCIVADLFRMPGQSTEGATR